MTMSKIMRAIWNHNGVLVNGLSAVLSSSSAHGRSEYASKQHARVHSDCGDTVGTRSVSCCKNLGRGVDGGVRRKLCGMVSILLVVIPVVMTGGDTVDIIVVVVDVALVVNHGTPTTAMDTNRIAVTTARDRFRTKDGIASRRHVSVLVIVVTLSGVSFIQNQAFVVSVFQVDKRGIRGRCKGFRRRRRRW